MKEKYCWRNVNEREEKREKGKNLSGGMRGRGTRGVEETEEEMEKERGGELRRGRRKEKESV